MTQIKKRRFLPSLIRIDVGDAPCQFVETGYLAVNSSIISKIEHRINLNSEGDFCNMVISHNSGRSNYTFEAQMDKDDCKQLLKVCLNKTKQYNYMMITDDEKNVIVNCYTMGIVLIDIDANSTNIPSYCGLEVTDDLRFREANLYLMRNELEEARALGERDKIIINKKKENNEKIINFS